MGVGGPTGNPIHGSSNTSGASKSSLGQKAQQVAKVAAKVAKVVGNVFKWTGIAFAGMCLLPFAIIAVPTFIALYSAEGYA